MRFIQLESVHDERVASYVNLTELQLRNRLEPQRGIFIAESMKVIERAIYAGKQPLSFLVENAWLDSMQVLFDYVDQRWGSDIPVYIAQSEQLQQLTGYRLHRGAIAEMRRWDLESVENICANANRIAIMDNIVDHTNVGALMRSAAALGIDAVLATPNCCDPLYRRAARVSMGTVFQIPWTRIGQDNKQWHHEGIAKLHELGFCVAAMALRDESITLDELTRRLHSSPDDRNHIEKLAVIFGNEGYGLTDDIINACDITVKIVMDHGVDSLNVAASSAVTFFAIKNHEA